MNTKVGKLEKIREGVLYSDVHIGKQGEQSKGKRGEHNLYVYTAVHQIWQVDYAHRG